MTTRSAILIGLVLYACLMVAVSVYWMMRVKKAADYLVAGRGLPWWIIVGTTVGTCIGTGVVIGASGLAYQYGWAGSAYPLGLGLGTLLVGLIYALMRRYQERVYATVYHMTGNHDDANDLTQETFIKAYQAIKSFKGDASFYTWLYRIAVNKTINFLKQRRSRNHLSLNDLDLNAEHDAELVALISDKTPRREAGLTELQEKLNAAMQKLSGSGSR